jgi:hypothetical protein
VIRFDVKVGIQLCGTFLYRFDAGGNAGIVFIE